MKSSQNMRVWAVSFRIRDSTPACHAFFVHFCPLCSLPTGPETDGLSCPLRSWRPVLHARMRCRDESARNTRRAHVARAGQNGRVGLMMKQVGQERGDEAGGSGRRRGWCVSGSLCDQLALDHGHRCLFFRWNHLVRSQADQLGQHAATDRRVDVIGELAPEEGRCFLQ